VKWGFHGGNADGGAPARWLGQGAAAHAEVASLAEAWTALVARFGQPDRIVIANVGGAALRDTLRVLLLGLAAEPVWIRAQARQCGVANAYRDPEQLGCDRWAALIGARSIEQRACLVVNAGTATTVDALSAAGEFLGGLILPGFDMMRASLARGTAGLPLADGEAETFPKSTGAAIWNGCRAAQAGAVERMWRALPGAAVCVIAGGAAAALADTLNTPVRVVDNLVLEGLLRIASEP
jgi:type III pantothenate kinase